MRFKFFTVILAATCSALFLNVVKAQTHPVRAKLKVDGKETRQKFRVLLYVAESPIELVVSDDGESYVPALGVETVGVRFISGKHDLFYDDVYLRKLRGQLVFGVKTNLSGEEDACESGKKLVAAYHLEFHPDDAEGTVMAVTVCK